MRDRLARSIPISAFDDDQIAQHSSNSSKSHDPPDNLPIAKRLRQLKGSKEGTGDARLGRRSARISLRHFATIRRIATALTERDPIFQTPFHLPKTSGEKLYIISIVYTSSRLEMRHNNKKVLLLLLRFGLGLERLN